MKETKRKDSKRNPHGLKRRSSYPLKDCNFRIAVLGEAGVGKSGSLCSGFVVAASSNCMAELSSALGACMVLEL